MTTRELLQQALGALEWEIGYSEECFSTKKVMAAIRAHLAKPEPEPAAWCAIGVEYSDDKSSLLRHGWKERELCPLFTKDQL